MGHLESSAMRKFHCNMKETEDSHLRKLTSQLEALAQKEANTPWRSRHQEIINLRAEINKVEIRKIIQKINATKSWFFEKINKKDKPLSKPMKKQREIIQINKIRNERGA